MRESSVTVDIAVVVVSAVTDSRDAAFNAGCDAYLSKPCPPEVLYLQIRALTRCLAAARNEAVQLIYTRRQIGESDHTR